MFNRLEALFLEIEARSGISKHRILLEAGIDPAQYRAYKRASRLLSDDMLTRLGRCEHVHVSVERLKAWKMLSEYGPGAVREAIQILEEETDLNSPIQSAG